MPVTAHNQVGTLTESHAHLLRLGHDLRVLETFAHQLSQPHWLEIKRHLAGVCLRQGGKVIHNLCEPVNFIEQVVQTLA